MTEQAEQTIDRDLLLTREEVTELLGADQATFEDWLERDWLRWIGALPSDPPARAATTAVLEVRDSWLREQVCERLLGGRTLIVDGLTEAERAELLRSTALARSPTDDLHRSLVNRQKRMRPPDAGPSRRRLPRPSVDLREQSLANGAEPAAEIETEDSAVAHAAATVIDEQRTNTVLVADLLVAIADAVIEVHREVVAVRDSVERPPAAIATGGADESALALATQLAELRRLLEEPSEDEPGAGAVDEEAVPLAQFQLVVQALQGIRAELAQEDEHREQLATGFGELVDQVIALREALLHQAPADVTDLTENVRLAQADLSATVNNATETLTATLQGIRDQLATTPGATPPPDRAEPRLEKIEDALHTLIEDSARVNIGKGEVAAAVVKLAEDLATVRAGIERSWTTSKTTADKIDRLLAEQTEDRVRRLAAEARAAGGTSTGLPWLVVAIAVLALSWSVVLFVKTGESKIPLTGMAAANLVCCIAVLLGTSRR